MYGYGVLYHGASPLGAMDAPGGTVRPATVRVFVARLYPHFVQITAPRGRGLPHEGHAPLAADERPGGEGVGAETGPGVARTGRAGAASPGTVKGELQAGQLICIPA